MHKQRAIIQRMANELKDIISLHKDRLNEEDLELVRAILTNSNELILRVHSRRA